MNVTSLVGEAPAISRSSDKSPIRALRMALYRAALHGIFDAVAFPTFARSGDSKSATGRLNGLARRLQRNLHGSGVVLEVGDLGVSTSAGAAFATGQGVLGKAGVTLAARVRAEWSLSFGESR